MMRYVSLVLFLILVGCQDIKKPEKPDNLISKDKMVDILVDAYLSNSARSFDNRLIMDRGIKLDSFIYTKHNVDSTQFAKSNAYYTIDLDEYGKMFREVETKLKTIEGQIKKEKRNVDEKEIEYEEETQDSVSTTPSLLVNPQVSESLDSIE